MDEKYSCAVTPYNTDAAYYVSRHNNSGVMGSGSRMAKRLNVLVAGRVARDMSLRMRARHQISGLMTCTTTRD